MWDANSSQATTVLAESLNIPLTIFFASPGEPLWIEIDAPQQKSLFVISTSPSSGYSRTRAAIRSDAGVTSWSTLGKRTRMPEAGPSSSNVRKRPIVDDQDGDSSSSARLTPAPDPERPLPGSSHSIPQAGPSDSMRGGRGLPSRADNDDTGDQDMDLDARSQPGIRLPSSRDAARREASPESRSLRSRPRKERPLFFLTQKSTSEDYKAHHGGNARTPGTQAGGHDPRNDNDDDGGPPLSQLMSANALEQIRASGLGLEDLNARELDALMEDEGEELGMDFGPSMPEAHALQKQPNASVTQNGRLGEAESNDEEEPSDTSYIPATQAPKVAMRDGKVCTKSAVAH
jgi:hypothetical protein